ncbi:TcfC E-set like domain-containing protein [Vibrio sp. 10N.247.311.51]|uniref:TcfC E-set like domain-containing protein n=1 Tax=Vibrio sp. 10N.247.311.51 TaxID=3229996 RepID=UPI003550D9D2
MNKIFYRKIKKELFFITVLFPSISFALDSIDNPKLLIVSDTPSGFEDVEFRDELQFRLYGKTIAEGYTLYKGSTTKFFIYTSSMSDVVEIKTNKEYTCADIIAQQFMLNVCGEETSNSETKVTFSEPVKDSRVKYIEVLLENRRINSQNKLDYLKESDVNALGTVTNYRITGSNNLSYFSGSALLDTTIGYKNSFFEFEGGSYVDGNSNVEFVNNQTALGKDYGSNRYMFSLLDDQTRLGSGFSNAIIDMRDIKQFSIEDASERRLGKSGQFLNIDIYMPSRGVVEVYRGSSLLYSAPHSEGHSFIDASALPIGTYDITIHRKLNIGTTLAPIVRTVTNRNTNNVDFLSFGVYDELNSGDTNVLFALYEKTIFSNQNLDVEIGGMLSDFDNLLLMKSDYFFSSQSFLSFELSALDESNYNFLGRLDTKLGKHFLFNTEYLYKSIESELSERFYVNFSGRYENYFFDSFHINYMYSALENSHANYIIDSKQSEITAYFNKFAQFRGDPLYVSYHVGVRDRDFVSNEFFFGLNLSMPLSFSDSSSGGVSLFSQGGDYVVSAYANSDIDSELIESVSADISHSRDNSINALFGSQIRNDKGSGNISLSMNRNSTDTDFTGSFLYGGSVVSSDNNVGFFDTASSSSGFLVENSTFDPRSTSEIDLISGREQVVLDGKLSFIPVAEYDSATLYVHSNSATIDDEDRLHHGVFYKGGVKFIELEPRNYFHVAGFIENIDASNSIKIVNHESSVVINRDISDGYFQLAVSEQFPIIEIFSDDRLLCTKELSNYNRDEYVYLGELSCETGF